MNNHDDFVDDYIEYRIFEESMKRSGGNKPPKKNSGCGCGTTAVIICIAVVVVLLFGSCSKSSSRPYSSGYRSSYSSSYGSSRGSSSGYSSGSTSHSSSSKPYSITPSKPTAGYRYGSKSKSSSSDLYDAKSYAYPENMYYDYPDFFWDYEDAEEYRDELN